LKSLHRQNIRSGIEKWLMAIAFFPSSFFNRRFLHQHSQSPTKSVDYNFVPQHGLFTIPGFHSHGLKDFEIDKKGNPADYQINRQRGVKREYPKNR
jgi:hypothetical protein